MRLPHDPGGTAGQRRARARARNPTWSAERRASRRWERKTPHARPGPPVLRISRGVCASVMTRRDGCLACIRAPPALRPPLGWGWTKVQDPGANARGDERVGVANGEFVGWVEFLRDPTPAITVADVGSREKLDPT